MYGECHRVGVQYFHKTFFKCGDPMTIVAKNSNAQKTGLMSLSSNSFCCADRSEASMYEFVNLLFVSIRCPHSYIL